MNILEIIVKEKKEEVKKLKNTDFMAVFNGGEYKQINHISFYEAINKKEKIGLIAEIKKASPSKGIITKNFNHLKIAENYFASNVEAISILTDEKFFMGGIKYLYDVAKIKEAPLLRKDFIIHDSQIYEAKTNGADAILLIAEILDKYQIKDFTLLAKEMEMDVLLEVHSVNMLDKIDLDINKIIGINNRDLQNFNVDINTTLNVAKYLPVDILKVSESGINKAADIEILKQAKINAILVGEHLMRAENIQDEIKIIKSELVYES